MARSESPLSWSSTGSHPTSTNPDAFGPRSERTSPIWTPRWRKLCWILFLVFFGSLAAELMYLLPFRSVKQPGTLVLDEDVATWLREPARMSFQKPTDLKVVALVFYSTRAKLSMLDCYLQQNLVSNGGMVDSVILIPETGDEEDQDWLALLAQSYPSYIVANESLRDTTNGQSGVNLAWNDVDPSTMYIHISAEIVYMESIAIPSLIETKLNQPRHAVVSANVVNQPTLSWIHHHLNVVRPYRPEMKPLLRPLNASALPRYDWRASDLPTWDGPRDFDVPADFGIPTDFKPPFNGHRWLPLRTDDASFNPMTHEVLDANGPGIWSWTTGALHHYSFLEHLENKQLYRYKFPMWDFQAEILSPSMMAMWGKDIIEVRPMPAWPDPDRWLSRELPLKVGGRYPLVDGRALAVHFAHENQILGLLSTDLLSRYEAYAMENICR